MDEMAMEQWEKNGVEEFAWACMDIDDVSLCVDINVVQVDTKHRGATPGDTHRA
jgi:hypothetical protein